MWKPQTRLGVANPVYLLTCFPNGVLKIYPPPNIYICVYYIATGREEVRIVANTILSFLGTQLVNWARLKFSQLWCLHQRRLGSALLLFLGGLLLQLGLDGCLVTTSWCWHFFRNRKIFRTCLNLKQEIQQVQETFP